MKFLSGCIAIGAIAFLAWYGYRHAADLPQLGWESLAFWEKMAAATALYIAAAVATAATWRFLLLSLGGKSNPLVAESVFLITQIGKYLPGNVGHFVGRFALAKARGLAAGPVGASMLCEQLLAASAAVFLVAFGYFIMPSSLTPLGRYLPGLPWLAGLLLAAGMSPIVLGPIANRISRWMPKRVRPAFIEIRRVGEIRTVSAVAAYVGIFSLLGLVVLEVAEAVHGAAALPMSVAAVVFAAAWIAGLVTPGAPGGMGVRETIMVVGFAPFVGEGTALTIALAMRLVSVAGDGISFLIGYAVDRLLQRRGRRAER